MMDLLIDDEEIQSPDLKQVDYQALKKNLVEQILRVPASEVDSIIDNWAIRSTQCAKPIKKDHLYFKCSDCSNQPSHCICEACFLASDHTGHNYLYFNKLTGGTCDCGDPNLQQLLLCGDHQLPSSEYKNICENIISIPHKQLIIEYFQKRFREAFENLEQLKILLEKPEKDIQYQKNSCMKLFQQVLQEVQAFINQNPIGTQLISKILIDSIPDFDCHHVCDAKDVNDPQFNKVSLEISQKCTCKIITNFFRYLGIYSNKVEYELELQMNYFFINTDFKMELVQVFCQMFYFMEVNYTDNSKLYRLFYQFNNVRCYEKFAEETMKYKYLFISYEKGIDLKQTNYKTYMNKMFFYYYIFYFIASNESNKEAWAKDFSLPLQAIRSICKSYKSNNLGGHFIFQRLISDYLFSLIINEIIQVLPQVSLELRKTFSQQIILALIDEIQIQKSVDNQTNQLLTILENCKSLEQDIINITQQNSFSLRQQKELVSKYENIFTQPKLEQFQKLTNIQQFHDHLKEMYLEIEKSLAEEKEKSNETLESEEMQIEEEVKQDEDTDERTQQINQQNAFMSFIINQGVQNIENAQFEMYMLEFFRRQQQASQKKHGLLYIDSDKRLKVSSLTEEIPFSECNFCPLFNLSFRIMSLCLYNLIYLSPTISEGLQLIHELTESASCKDEFNEVLLFAVKQLGENFEYLRYHSEITVGYNDYNAINLGLAGKNADLVSIEKNYLNPEYKLHDLDIMSLQVFLIVLNSSGLTSEFFKNLIQGIKVNEPNQDSNLQLKRFTNLLRNIMITSFDTSAVLNCYNQQSENFSKWLHPSLRSVLNAAFQSSKSNTISTLKTKLTELKINKQVPIKYELLSLSKIVDEKFERIEGLKFVFEPFLFLRENKLHSNYYDLLKEFQLQNPSIEYIIGNSMETMLRENEFFKEIVKAVCSDDQTMSLYQKGLDLLDLQGATRDKLPYNCAQFSIKFIYMFLLIMKESEKPEDVQKLKAFISNERIQQRLMFLKEHEKEFVKSIQIVDSLITEIKKTFSDFENSQLLPTGSQNDMGEEDDADHTIFKQRAREAQMRYMALIQQKQEGFFQANKDLLLDQSLIDDQKSKKSICIYCQDPEDKGIQIVQAYLERDNIDSFTNKPNKLAKSRNFKFVMSNCSHTSHFDCREKARFHSKYKFGVLIPAIENDFSNRRKTEGFCQQCRSLNNIGIPILDTYLKQQLTKTSQNEFQLMEKPDVSDSLILDILDSNFKLIESIVLFTKSSNTNLIVQVYEQSITSSSHTIFSEGIQVFYKRIKLLNTNLYLNSRIFLHQSSEQFKESRIEYMQEIISCNLKVLLSLSEFQHIYFTNSTKTVELIDDCYLDLIQMYVQTCLYLSLLEDSQTEQQNSVNSIISISKTVFNSVLSINAKILSIQSGLSFKSIHEIMENQEFMESLMDYVMPWSNLISATIMMLYTIQGEDSLEKYVLSDRKGFNFESEVYRLESELFPFLKVTPESFIEFNTLDITESLVQSPIMFLETEKLQSAVLGKNYKENHRLYFSKRCNQCLSYPHATQSDLHLCLICSKQMCSITCEEVNLFEPNQKIASFNGQLNKHAQQFHEGKSIFLNLLENQLVLIDSPMSIVYDHLYFDLIKQPIKIEPTEIVNSNLWEEHTLDEGKLRHYLNILRTHQLPNKIRSFIQFSSLPMSAIKHQII